MLPEDPYRPVTTTGGLLEQLTAYKGAFGSCTASLEAIAAWKASLAPTPDPTTTE